MDLRGCDPHGFLVDDGIAFHLGLRIELRAVQMVEGGIIVLPTSYKFTRTKMKCMLPQWVAAHFAEGDIFTIQNFDRRKEGDQLLLVSRDQHFLPLKKVGNIASTRALEGYAGIAGWCHGAKLCGLESALCIEIDQQTADACGRSLGWPVLSATDAIDAIKSNDLPDKFVLQADMNSRESLFVIGLLGLAMWLISPPCQPWSKAGNMIGLQVEGGQAFVTTILNAAMLGVSMVLAENVPGFPQHKHYQDVIAHVKKAGWRCVMSSQDGVLPTLPIYRTRWLGIFVPDTISFDHRNVSRAKNTNLPNSIPGRGKSVSIATGGCYQTNIQTWEREAATPSEEAITAMSMPGFLPLNMRTEQNMRLGPQEILKLRTKCARNVMPNVMASNGSQHELPTSLLQARGLHAFVIQDSKGIRFALPFEIAMALGYPVETQLPSNFKSAWQIVGNGLSIPQAALSCFRAHILLQEQSPFKTQWKSTFDLVAAFLSTTVDLDDYIVEQMDGWMMLKHKIAARTISSPEDHEFVPPTYQSIEPAEDRPAKIPCIPPTWTCEDNEPDVFIPNPRKEDYPWLADVALVTMELDKGSLIANPPNPLPSALMDLMKSGMMKHTDEMHTVTILHQKGFWCKFVWKKQTDSIKDCIRKVLPHAMKEHFISIHLDMEAVTFNTCPRGVQDCEIIFEPVVFVRIFKATFNSLDIAAQVDLTWTFADAIAFVASELAVLPSVVNILCEDLLTPKDAFVLAYPCVEFTLCFERMALPMDRLSFTKPHPCAGEAFPEPCQDQIQGMTIQNDTCKNELIRFATKDVKWGSIRTVVCPRHWCIEQLSLLMFPNQTAENPMCVFVDGRSQPPDTCIEQIIAQDNLTMGMFMLSATKLEAVCQESSLNTAYPSIQIFIKGPEDHRPKLRQVPMHYTLTKIAAILLAKYKCNTTMLTLVGGKAIDPCIIVGNLPQDTSIEFRLCALLGGAKNEETIKNLANVLSERGVPKEHAMERAKTVIGKIPAPEVKAILNKDPSSMWSELKGLANKAQVRLITTTELKNHQKKMRDEKKEKTKPAPKRQRKEVDPKQVTIDLGHFKADDCKLQAIDIGAFGPDAMGIAMAKPNEAKTFLPRSRLSPDPLGLLVLTHEPFDNQHPQLIPALDQKNQPVLISAVLLNFGDIPVTYQPNVPKADIVEVDAAILEINIQKQYVPSWAEVVNPLNFLGQKLPELRTGVIAAWNLRFYKEDRSQTNHQEADYVHGFLKVPTSQLDPTLQRSGQHGVFAQVKAPNKKPDPAYGVVPLHGFSHDEAMTLAKRTANVLGIVMLNQKGTFALRGKRENIAEIRRIALPQGISPQEGQIPPGATWWYLRSINTSTNCTELSNALKSLGWNATAVRPSGASTWLVCSYDSPPSSHLLLSGQYVAVVACGLTNKKATIEKKTTNAVVQGNFSMDPEELEHESVSTSASTRFEDMKNNLEERLNQVMTEKFNHYDQQIKTIQGVIEQTRAR
eukprot:Skav226293  [mRNA]  locus=scaffold3301:263788:268242:+ [translate_table: standard]